MYAKLTNLLKNYIKPSTIFKYGFNLSPMYRRSTGRLYHVSDDLTLVKVKIKKSWKNINYVGTIFGGSMASATDPIYMLQLVSLLGDDYVVWDKAATIRFKRPAREDAYVNFEFSDAEIENIKQKVKKNKEIDVLKELNITNKEGSAVFAHLEKTIYVANKAFYKEKIKSRKRK